jgi:hypothetical protein
MLGMPERRGLPAGLISVATGFSAFSASFFRLVAADVVLFPHVRQWFAGRVTTPVFMLHGREVKNRSGSVFPVMKPFTGRAAFSR